VTRNVSPYLPGQHLWLRGRLTAAWRTLGPIHAGIPFLALGLGTLVLSATILVVLPFGRSSVVIGLSLFGVGAIALVAGMLATSRALAANDPAGRVPEAEVSAGRAGERGADSIERGSPANSVSISGLDSSPSELMPDPGLMSDPSPPRGTSHPSGFYAPPGRPPTRAARSSPSTLPEAEPQSETDEVLQSLDEIYALVRREVPSREATDPQRTPKKAPARVCGSCDKEIPISEPNRSCRRCGLMLCRACNAVSESDGHPGFCPTCSLLEDPDIASGWAPSPPFRAEE
jgi:hypothetical protein